MKIQGTVAIITFDESSIGSGLIMINGSCPVDPGYCASFIVTDSIGNQFDGQPEIQGNTIVVSTNSGYDVYSVRFVLFVIESDVVSYLFAPWPVCTLYNKEGFPAPPFYWIKKGEEFVNLPLL